MWRYDSVPVPGWYKQHSAGTQRPPWPSSEWPAPWPPSHRPPARSPRRSCTTREKKKIRGGGGVSELMESMPRLLNPPHNHTECFLINIQATSSVTADTGWQTGHSGAPLLALCLGPPTHATSAKNASHGCVCAWGGGYLPTPQLPSTSTLIVSLLKFN